MTWTDISVRERLKRTPNFNDFLEGKVSVLIDKIEDATFLIFANADETCALYFQAPFNPKLDYSCIDSFFDVAKPIIDGLLKEASERRLCATNL